MTDIMAAIGLAQLKRYHAILERRKQIIHMYNNALLNNSLLEDMVDALRHYGDNFSSSGHLYLARLLGKDEKYRNRVIERMAEKGIATNVHYKPLPMLTAYKNLGFDINNFPNSFNMYKNEITLPLHTLLSDEQVEYIVENFKEIINN